MIFLTILLIPALVALGFLVWGKGLVSLGEFLIQLGAMCLYSLLCMGIVYWSNTSDTEYINGVVSAKRMERVSCRHPYCCRWCESCSSDGRGGTSCTTYCCSTCYDHPYDQDWNVYSNVQRAWSIDTLDRQGLREPPRWTSTRVGEPVSWLHSYENYVKAAPGTLFKRDTREDEKTFPIPKYEPRVHDYWHANRLYAVNVEVPEANRWNTDLEELNGRLGPAKQANAMVVVVKDQPREYFEALRAAWIGGKKNDVILVIGVDADLTLKWADVMAWSYNEMVRVSLRDEIMLTQVRLDREKTLAALEQSIVQYFDRKHMKDFAYLKSSVSPTGFQYGLSVFIGCLISVGLGILFLRNDVV